jgi:hypothetical protein
MKIIPFNWCPTEQQIDEFIEIIKQLMLTSSEEEHRKVLEKFTLPEIRCLLSGFYGMSRESRRNFRLFRQLCEERFGTEALKLPDHRRRGFRNS